MSRNEQDMQLLSLGSVGYWVGNRGFRRGQRLLYNESRSCA
jgi:hypothetical protein